MAIRIAHEAPIGIFEFVQNHTEYDYALVHLLDSNKEYRDMFFKAKEQGREIYLDNSIFELGEAYDSDKYVFWINELQPDYYIIPDTLEDYYKTHRQVEEWYEKYTSIPGKKIGVVQGKTLETVYACYEHMKNRGIDMIAFSFDYSLYSTLFPHPNKFVSYAMGRVLLLSRMLQDGVIDTTKKHHLLGCALPIEFRYYREAGFDWIHSLDTSNPIVHAIYGVKYEENLGLMTKDTRKLEKLVEYPEEKINKDLLIENLYTFRRITNGRPLGTYNNG